MHHSKHLCGESYLLLSERVVKYLPFLEISLNDIILQVEAGEKKKKKTGRAKRRIQYNRRFVNVVETFGRKKGPNSNS